MLVGVAAVVTVPAGIALAERYANVRLVDASWAIPVAFGLGLLAIALANLARTRIHMTVGRAGGESRARVARILGTLGICLALTASISVGFYELLLRLEK
ncbi:MAG TPA: hypothetical protein VH416_08245 [Gaiellaceae bacterium]